MDNSRFADRRTFMQAGLAALGSAAACAGTCPAEPERANMPRQIIDTHTHFYDPTRPEGVPWPGQDSPLYRKTLPGDYMKLAAPRGVTGTVVVEASPWLADNRWLLDLAKDEPAIVGVVGNLSLGEDGFAANLKRLARNRLFRGIRIRGGDLMRLAASPAIAADLARLADADCSVDVLRPKRLADVAALAKQIPNLRIIINHFPRDIPESTGGNGDSRDEDALAAVAAQANVFAKASNVLRKENGQLVTDLDGYRGDLDAIWKHFGEDRVIYGSNWPVCELVAPYASVQQIVGQYVAERGPTARDKYFWQNAQAVYKWVDRSAEK